MHKTILTILILSVFAGCSNETKQNSSENAQAAKKDTIAAVKTILFFGNSLTAGYGLDESSEAFPALIQEKIDSLGLSYKVVNAGLSGETTSGGKGRINWLLNQKIDVFVLELGANDGLRGIPVDQSYANLQAILDQVREKYPKVKILLLGMEVPPNMGHKYVTGFRAIFKKLADKNEVAFIPFMLDGVAGNPSLNQGDGIHPTAEGTRIVAENIWIELKGLL